MLRFAALMGALALVVGNAVDAFAAEPRGLSFSQGGGYHYAPREHHVTMPTYGGHRLYGYGPPLTLGFASPYGYGYPMSYGYPISYGTLSSPGYYWPEPTPISRMVDSPMMAPVNALPANISPLTDLPEPKSKADPAERPVLPSSAAATVKARHSMAEGDQHIREQEWLKAYASYRQAATTADDLAEAHLRYGIILAVLHRYERAATEFRRAVFIEPSLPFSDFSLETLMGPDSRLVRMSILSRIADWVNEDVADPQRLYVLGVMLHFDGDGRAKDLFTAALRMTSGSSYVLAYLPKEPPASTEAPPRPGLDEGPDVGAAPRPDASTAPQEPLPAAPEPERGS